MRVKDATAPPAEPAADNVSEDVMLQRYLEGYLDPLPPSVEFSRATGLPAGTQLNWVRRADGVEQRQGSGRGAARAYRLDDGSYLLVLDTGGYWYEHKSVCGELGPPSAGRPFRGIAVTSISDVISSEVDGERRLHWYQSVQGLLEVEVLDDETVRMRLRVDAGFPHVESRGSIVGHAEVRLEQVEALPLIVRRYLRDSRR